MVLAAPDAESVHLSLTMQERFFSPESKLWQIDREMALVLAGGRALLMQLAHPKIAAGVAEHSNFKGDPLGRLYRTMNAMWSIVFGPPPRARTALRRVNAIHGNVHGTVPLAEPGSGGLPYDAFEQPLLLWVHATLVDTALAAYELFVKALTEEEKLCYYEDSKNLARLFDIRDDVTPTSLGEFRAYMKQMLAGQDIAAGPTARALARDILFPRPWFLKPGGPLFRLLTAGLLPPKLRDAYEIPWNGRREQRFHRAASVMRSFLHFVPPPLRIVPQARRAERQLRTPSPR